MQAEEHPQYEEESRQLAATFERIDKDLEYWDRPLS